MPPETARPMSIETASGNGRRGQSCRGRGISLDEERTGGEVIILGRYTSLLSGTTLVTTEGPDGRALVGA